MFHCFEVIQFYASRGSSQNSCDYATSSAKTTSGTISCENKKKLFVKASANTAPKNYLLIAPKIIDVFYYFRGLDLKISPYYVSKYGQTI